MPSAKRSVLLTTGVFLLCVAVAFPVPPKRDMALEYLPGEWRGKHEGIDVVVIFGPKNLFQLKVDKEVVDGTYTLDPSKKPMHLDIRPSKKDLGGVIKTICECTAKGELRVANSQPGADRPTEFKDAILLTRVPASKP